MTAQKQEGKDMSAKRTQPIANGCIRIPRLPLVACCVAVLFFGWMPHQGKGQIVSPADSQAYQLTNADAATIAPQLDRLLRDYGASAQILIDRSQNCLVVQGPQASRQLAGQLLQTLDKPASSAVVLAQAEERGTVKGYPTDPDKVEGLAEQLRKQFPPSMGVRVAPDARTSQVVVIAPVEIHDQIQVYLSRPNVPEAGTPADTRFVPGMTQRYQLQNITWREFEQSLRALWGPSLQITADDATGLLAVSLVGDERDIPLMKVNRQNNEITFLQASGAARSWRQIAIALDRTHGGQAVTTQLVPLRRADPAKVREAVTAIRDAALRTSPGETLAAVPVSQPGRPREASGLVSMIFQPGGQAPQAPAGGAPPAAPAQGPAATPDQQPGVQPGPAGDQPLLPGEEGDAEGLLGDVQIEFVPELGVIILRGNKRDVERVRRIIDEIEKESTLTRPEVQVAPLQYTNSESMTTLVTQIYDTVYAPRQGTLSITALVKPNAILLVGRQENIATALSLIEKLDQPVAPDTQIKVFRLMYMPALNAEQYIRSFYGAAGGTTTGVTAGATQAQQTTRGLSPRITVIGDYRSNSLIVQASPRDLEEVAELLKELDVDKTEATIEVRIFPLTNSMASTLATVLQQTLINQAQGLTGQAGFAQQAVGTNQQNQTPVSQSVQIIGIDQAGNKIIQSGLLTEVQITADDNSNALVVKAPSQSMGLIAALIKQLDKIPSAESQIKVFQIKNGDATNLTSMLQTLFGQQVTAGTVGVFSQTIGRTFGTQGQLQQATAGESSLIPLNFGVDARTNSIIASGSAADLAVVEAILLRLDEGDLRQRKLIVYRLNNAPAQYVADALTDILNQQQQLLQQQQSQQFSLISQFEFIDQQVYVVPEIISNTLIVSATPKYYEQVTEVIQDLDRRPPMIMIQVVVCSVRLEDNEEKGVELGIQDSLLFDRSAVTDGLLDPGFDFVNSPLGNAGNAASLATRGALAGQGFGAFGVGRTSATEGFPGLVLSASNESLSILIRALVRKSRAQILSRPQIMTLNNVPASVLVGQRIPQITDFQTLNTGGTVNSIELIDVGVSLGVIPRVTPDGLIIMDIEANESKAGDPAEGITIGVSDGVPIQSPIYDDVTAITTVAARSGQTVVFGGLITRDRADTFRGVPYLAELPVVGHLFRFDTKSDTRQELIFFLTPHIVTTDEELQQINQTESERMSWCMADIVDVHGNPGFSGGPTDPWSAGTPMIYPTLDPTAEGFSMPEYGELVPTPQQLGPGVPAGPSTSDKPFILPPDQRSEGKPFVRPPDQREEGKPFVVPPDQQVPGKPFIETPQESRRRMQGARIELQEQHAAGWRAPDLRDPWSPQAMAHQGSPSRLQPVPSGGGDVPDVQGYPNSRVPGSAAGPGNAARAVTDGVIPAHYQQSQIPAPVTYPQPYQYPTTYPAGTTAR